MTDLSTQIQMVFMPWGRELQVLQTEIGSRALGELQKEVMGLTAIEARCPAHLDLDWNEEGLPSLWTFGAMKGQPEDRKYTFLRSDSTYAYFGYLNRRGQNRELKVNIRRWFE